MSAFNNNSVTLKGAAIIASLVTGSTLTFTRIAVGDGTLASGQTALTRERLVNPLFNVPISSVESNNAAQAVVKGTFSNADLNTGFYYREIGLFAINPDTNAEELFLYGNAGTEAEWINPAGQSSLIEKEIHLVTLIGNASNVTAVFDENAKVLKSEFDAIVPLKADLDAKPENGGRVLASQMRFDEVQNLYVDAAAANGGDGTQAKPFKTIAEAVNARYMGAPVVNIYIKPGTYAERVNVPRSPGTAWRFERAGTGTVSIQGLTADNPAFLVLDYLTFNPPAGSTDPCVSVLNCPHTSLSTITVNGNANITGVNISAGRARFLSCVLNNCGIGVVAVNGSDLTMRNTTGTGNNKGLEANSSVIITDQNIPGATTPYAVYNGGTINVQGGQSSFPSNYSQLYPLGTFSTADDLRTALLQTFGKLATNESRGCWFTNAISGGFGIFTSGQALQIEVVKSAATHGIVFFKSYYNQPLAYMQIRNNAFLNALPVAFAKEEPATAATFGLIRTTSAETGTEINCQCDDAAVTPESLYKLSDYRRAGVSYSVGAVVACPYHVEFMLKCTQAGRTATSALDTTNVTKGQVITDGGVNWEVIAKSIVDASINDKVITLTFTDGTTKTLKTDNVTNIPANSDLNNYKTAGKYSCWVTSNAKTLTNNPMSEQSTGIILEVIADGNTVLQILYGTLIRGMYVRRYSGSWNEWKRIDSPYTESATSIGGASATKPAVVVESYKDGYNWYRVYSDGWIEQGGRVPPNSGSTPTLTLHKPMADEKYHISITVHTYTTNSAYDTVLFGGSYGESVTTTSFKLMSANYNGTNENAMYRTWYVCGKGA